jgi:hypothetical protein
MRLPGRAPLLLNGCYISFKLSLLVLERDVDLGHIEIVVIGVCQRGGRKTNDVKILRAARTTCKKNSMNKIQQELSFKLL